MQIGRRLSALSSTLAAVASVAAVLSLVSLLLSAPAAAQAAAFSLRSELDGVPFGRQLSYLADPRGELRIEDMSKPEVAARFVASGEEAPTLGLTRDAYWLRVVVHNPGDRPLTWLLEIAYPALDYITLYAPRASGGFDQRATGDRLPFSTRDIAYRNFLFALEEPAHGTRTYYLRVHTEGSMLLPLKAWTQQALFEHQGREMPVIWMFYGLNIVMACYNFFLFMFVRQREYLYYVLYILSFGVLAFTLAGHTSQYLLPDRPALANKMMVLSIGSTFLWVCLFAGRSLALATQFPRLNKVIHVLAGLSVVLLVFALLVPYAWALRAMTMMGATCVTVGPALIYSCARAGSRPAKLFLVAWGCLIAGTILHYTQLLGILPVSFLTYWGIQLGASLEVLLLSLALADRINTMRGDLGSLNAQLSQHVAHLELALSRAEQATRAKSEFLATMSHELRTPLNAIINIPQGLAGEFRMIRGACCSACGALFELDPGEQVGAGASCPACQAEGGLQSEALRRYAGAPDQTLRHLGTVERAGKHLLQMVNGILDFSKMEAGHVALKCEDVLVLDLVREACDTTAELAARAGVTLVLEPGCEQALVRCDPLRLKQVLINLIGNAIKFSDGAGQVEVGVRRVQDAYVFHVRDHGIGIAPQNFEKIFRSFEQVEQGDTRKYGGTGLGLSISRSLVEMHGGEIWVESALGSGSTFFFRVPAEGMARASAREPVLPPQEAWDATGARPRPLEAMPAVDSQR